mgnify:CR=1 FL=1
MNSDQTLCPPNLQPDLEPGRAFISRNSPPGRVLLCAVTGSHFYGFPAPDSDLDLKGIHLAPTRSLLGLSRPDPAVNAEGLESGILCDYTSNEAEQALRLLLKGNGNMLERIFSPIQLYKTEEHKALIELAPSYLSRRVLHHYKGFFQQVCEQHLKDGDRRIKPLLYAYRTALTGVHLLLTKELVGDLRRLAPLYGFDAALELIEIYQSSSEKKTLDPAEDARHQAFWPTLLERLEMADCTSPLPDDPPAEQRCSDWLVGLRLGTLA